MFGGPLDPCGTEPLTGYYRDGDCRCGPEDQGLHAVCAVMTEEFLAHQNAVGNDLITPQPEWGFPGLLPGDRWCVVAVRWLQAREAPLGPRSDQVVADGALVGEELRRHHRADGVQALVLGRTESPSR